MTLMCVGILYFLPDLCWTLLTTWWQVMGSDIDFVSHHDFLLCSLDVIAQESFSMRFSSRLVPSFKPFALCSRFTLCLIGRLPQIGWASTAGAKTCLLPLARGRVNLHRTFQQRPCRQRPRCQYHCQHCQQHEHHPSPREAAPAVVALKHRLNSLMKWILTVSTETAAVLPVHSMKVLIFMTISLTTPCVHIAKRQRFRWIRISTSATSALKKSSFWVKIWTTTKCHSLSLSAKLPNNCLCGLCLLYSKLALKCMPGDQITLLQHNYHQSRWVWFVILNSVIECTNNHHPIGYHHPPVLLILWLIMMNRARLLSHSLRHHQNHHKCSNRSSLSSNLHSLKLSNSNMSLLCCCCFSLCVVWFFVSQQFPNHFFDLGLCSLC